MFNDYTSSYWPRRWRKYGHEAATRLAEQDVEDEADNREAERLAREERRNEAQQALRRAGGTDLRVNMSMPLLNREQRKARDVLELRDERREETRRRDEERKRLREENEAARRKMREKDAWQQEAQTAESDSDSDVPERLPRIRKADKKAPRRDSPEETEISRGVNRELSRSQAVSFLPTLPGAARRGSMNRQDHQRSERHGRSNSTVRGMTYWREQKEIYGMDRTDRYGRHGFASEPHLSDLGPPLEKDMGRLRRTALGLC